MSIELTDTNASKVASALLQERRKAGSPTMGMILTALGGLTTEAFRVAWLVQYPVWAFAVVAVLITRRKSRKLDAARGVVPRPLREVFSSSR